MNRFILNSEVLNKTAFIAGVVFLSAVTTAEATITSADQRWAKAYAVTTTASATTELNVDRLAKASGNMQAEVSISDSSVKYAAATGAIAYGESVVTDTANRVTKALAKTITGESLTNAEGLRYAFMESQYAYGSATTSGSITKQKYLSASSNAVAWITDQPALIKTISVRPVYVTGSIIARATSYAFANMHMGRGYITAEAITTSYITPKRATKGSITIDAFLDSNPNKIRAVASTFLAEATLSAEISITKNGTKTSYLSVSFVGESKASTAVCTRFAKATAEVTSESLISASITKIQHAKANSVCDAILSPVKLYRRVAAGHATAQATLNDASIRLAIPNALPVLCSASVEASPVRYAVSLGDMQATAYLVPAGVRLAKMYGNSVSTAEITQPIDAVRYANAWGDIYAEAQSVSDSVRYAYSYGQNAEAEVELADTAVKLTPAVGSTIEAVASTTGLARIWAKCYGNAYGEATTSASSRSSEGLNADPKRTITVKLENRTLIVAEYNRILRV